MDWLSIVAVIIGCAFGCLVAYGIMAQRAAEASRAARKAMDALALDHARELAEAETSGVMKFRQSIWHEQACQGPHDFPREPDFRKGKWLQYHCVRCGHVLWRDKFQAGLGIKAGG